MEEIYEMKGRSHSARAIARELGLARNTVLRYLKSTDATLPRPRLIPVTAVQIHVFMCRIIPQCHTSVPSPTSEVPELPSSRGSVFVIPIRLLHYLKDQVSAEH